MKKIEGIKVDETGCIEWAGRLNEKGYGSVCRWTNGKGKHWRAHRLAWFQSYGAIPDGVNVLHKCDNRKCINVAHLFLGTQKDNVDDAIKKSRWPQHYGNAKLTAEDRKTIRHLYFAEQRTQKEIASFFSVSPPTISGVITGRTWGGALRGL